MSLDTQQYDYRGTRSSWRHWKRLLKRMTARKRRRLSFEDDPKRVTAGWVS